MATFAELYCRHYGVAAKNFERSMFWRCLHRRAWPLVAVVRIFNRDYFAPDMELIRDLGRRTQATSLTEDIADYHSHPMNVGVLRHRLRIRISIRRVSKEAHRLLPGRAPATFYDTPTPFGQEAPGAQRPAAGGEAPHSASS